jgi:hypothetical protein
MLRRFSAVSALPLTLAIQGVALMLVAVFSSSDAPRDSGRVGTGELPKADVPIAAEFQIPRDLARERLPVPKFPNLDEPGKNQAPKPDPQKPKAPIAAGDKLSALRVSSVALAGLVSMNSPTRVPDAPDVLGLNDIGGSSGRSWLGGNDRTSRGPGGFLGPSDTGEGGSGRGGSGLGGIFHGDGDNCMPGRRGLIGRGELPRGRGIDPGSVSTPGRGGDRERGSQPRGGDRPSRSGSKR